MAGKLTQTQIIATLADKTGMAKKDVKGFLGDLASLAHEEARNNGEFTIPGVGKLVKQQREARTGRNPRTGESIAIPARTVLRFRIAKAAKDAVLAD